MAEPNTESESKNTTKEEERTRRIPITEKMTKLPRTTIYFGKMPPIP